VLNFESLFDCSKTFSKTFQMEERQDKLLFLFSLYGFETFTVSRVEKLAKTLFR
jgi:hypothetical protein